MSVDFKWDSPGLKKAEFIALTSLLSMRNGGQLEPLDNFDARHDGADESEDETASQHTDDTTRPRQFTVSSKDNLRRQFLDRFAEVLSKKKDARHVACAVMQEQEGCVRIWVARNEGFDQSDSDFLSKFASCLSNNVGGGGLGGKKVPGTVPGVCPLNIEPNSTVEAELWNILASYYEERLHYYAANLDIPEHHDIMRRLPSRSLTLHRASYRSFSRPSPTKAPEISTYWPLSHARLMKLQSIPPQSRLSRTVLAKPHLSFYRRSASSPVSGPHIAFSSRSPKFFLPLIRLTSFRFMLGPQSAVPLGNHSS